MKKILFYIALIVSLSPPGRTPSLRIICSTCQNLLLNLFMRCPLKVLFNFCSNSFFFFGVAPENLFWTDVQKTQRINAMEVCRILLEYLREPAD